MDQVGKLRQAGDHPHAVGELLAERRVLLRGLVEQSRETAQPDADDRQAVVDRGADRRVARLGEKRRDVPRRGLEGLGRDAALGQLSADLQERDLPARLVVDQPGDPPDLGDALDLHPGAAGHADVDVLAGGAVPPADFLRAAAELADEVARLGGLLRGEQVGLGHHLDQRHAKPVGQKRPVVAVVGDLAAGVLLEAELPHADRSSLEGQLAVDAQDGRPLEARGD